MESFAGKLAVVTGGGSGRGRELVIQLAGEGCSVATCDVQAGAARETQRMAETKAAPGSQVSAHVCDVSDEGQVLHFREQVLKDHGTDHIDLLFNNAGIAAGGSFIVSLREIWERTFAVDWWGVYYCIRAFLPLLMESTEALLVNAGSANGFWASLGPGAPHTAYSTAKFAVKGFSEALIEDLRVHAPHVGIGGYRPVGRQRLQPDRQKPAQAQAEAKAPASGRPEPLADRGLAPSPLGRAALCHRPTSFFEVVGLKAPDLCLHGHREASVGIAVPGGVYCSPRSLYGQWRLGG